jgi:hypothetical protein
MARARPVLFRWNAATHSMVANRRFEQMAASEYRDGEEYPMVVQEMRSAVSHNHYFAAVNDGWNNLPESIADDFKTSTHLRKWCLVQTGYANEKTVVCDSQAEVTRLVRTCCMLDEFAVLKVSGNVVKIFTPLSQSNTHMDKKTFQESKQAVLDKIAELIGTSAETLSDNAGQSA